MVIRLCGAQEREIALSLILVTNYDLIVLTNAKPDALPDPPNRSSVQLQDAIDNAIGSASYDLGHALDGTGGGALCIRRHRDAVR